MRYCWHCLILFVFLMNTPLLWADVVVERLMLYSSGQDTAFRVTPWNMNMEHIAGGIRTQGTCLWFNTDWQAKPWAGVRFEGQQVPSFTLTKDWIEKGFIQLFINVTVDRYGNIGAGGQYQIKPHVKPELGKYQAIRSQFIARGRGIDQEATTWQEVLVPLKYFTDLKPGYVIDGLSFQTRYQVELTFSLDEVGFVRFDELPEWMVQQLNQDVKQSWVTWPAYDDLPEVVKADQRPLSVQNAKFVTPDGKRAFLLNPYLWEDARSAYGNKTPDKLPSTYGLYDRDKHGWIYDEIPTTEHLCRLGFNSMSVTPQPESWWYSVGYGKNDGRSTNQYLQSLVSRATLPYYIDLVSWPYTMGKPGLKIDQTDLPASAATVGRNHWTQYRIIGAGRQAWLDMWAHNARRYRDVGARSIILELMNEPAYMGESADHYAEFEQWLVERYGSIDKVNDTWGTSFRDLSKAAQYRFSYNPGPSAGQRLDYDEYLSERFADMIDAGVSSVSNILDNTLVGLQTMGGYMHTPHDAVWKHRIAKHETVVLTPTGGGRWTRGSGAFTPSDMLTSHSLADAPLENDLLLAVADDKMIVDNETYLRGQTRLETRNRLWEHVVCGLDGLTIFSWNKRGWVWWTDRDAVQTDADKYPYSSLIPLARRTDALRGILDFSTEVQTLAPQILSKPWGPSPMIGLLYSWDHARRRVVESNLYDKFPVYYAALRYSHWNMCLLPSDQVLSQGIPEDLDVIVVGALTHVEREIPEALIQFVKRGGVLVMGESDRVHDVYGRKLTAWHGLLPGVSQGIQDVTSTLDQTGIADTLYSGDVSIRRLQCFALSGRTSVTMRDSAGSPIVIRRSLGKGMVYYQTADLFGYALAKVLYGMLDQAAQGSIPSQWRPLNIIEVDGRLAANVLVSHRCYKHRKALLLLNRDHYERQVKIKLSSLTGTWQVQHALDTETKQVMTGTDLGTQGIDVTLPAAGPAVILLERSE